MTREEAIAFLDEREATTNAAPVLTRFAPAPVQESTFQYVSRSPLVQDAVGNVARGARGVRYLGREAARDIGTGWDVTTAPVRYAGAELGRTVVNPLARFAVGGLDAAQSGIESFERGAGNLAGRVVNYANQNVVQPAVDWFNRRVLPPPILTPQTRQEYDAIPVGSLYVDPEDGKTRRKM